MSVVYVRRVVSLLFYANVSGSSHKTLNTFINVLLIEFESDSLWAAIGILLCAVLSLKCDVPVCRTVCGRGRIYLCVCVCVRSVYDQ